MRLKIQVLGLAVIYLCGVSYLYWNITVVQGKATSIAQIARIGALLPLPGDVVKILLLFFLIKVLRKRGFTVLDPEESGS